MYARRWTFVLFASCAVLSGCSGGGDKGITDPGGRSSCSITVSGAQTGTYGCTAAGITEATTASSNVLVMGTSTSPIIMGLVGFNGNLTTGTYRSTDAKVSAISGVSLQNAQDQIWEAWSDTVSPSQGSFTLTLSSLKLEGTSDGSQVYSLHGTFDATLLPSSLSTPATGTVTVHMVF
jgi:hypothetical protein